MADTQQEILGKVYGETIMQLAQQKRSKTYDAVWNKPNIGGKNYFQDRIGQWLMEQKVGRQVPTPLSDPNLSRRMGIMKDFFLAKPLDKEDELKILSSPRSAYSIAGGNAVARKYDDENFAAALGTAYGGEEGTTAIVLPAIQKIAAGAVGLTKEKVKLAARKLNDFDVEDEERFLFMSPQGLEDLLAETEVTSSDFTTLQALQSGSVGSWMGFTARMSTRLPKSSTTRSCIAWQKMGICLGEATSPVIRTDERADLSYLWQLYAAIHIGSTRLEDERVVQIDITEA